MKAPIKNAIAKMLVIIKTIILSKLMALFAIEQGVREIDAEKWLTQLTEADEKNRYGFVNFPVLTSAPAI